jgi:hypothetical protein
MAKALRAFPPQRCTFLYSDYRRTKFASSDFRLSDLFRCPPVCVSENAVPFSRAAHDDKVASSHTGRMQKRNLAPPVTTSPLAVYLKKGAYVRLTKLRAVPGGMPACPRPIYTPGAWSNILSLPILYWMEGVLLADIVKRDFIRLHRCVRDGVVARGIFSSTPICAVSDSEVTTYNSIYLVELVTPFIPGLCS